MKATIPIDKAGVPRVKVLGVIAREDGELVADIIELPVKCELEHQVRRKLERVKGEEGGEGRRGGGVNEGKEDRESTLVDTHTSSLREIVIQGVPSNGWHWDKKGPSLF